MNLNFSNIRGVRRDRDFIRVSGGDSIRFLQGMWTCDINLLGQSVPAASGAYLLNLKAKPVSSARILSYGDKFYISCPAGRGAETVTALDRFLVADDVELELLEGESVPFSMFTIWGEELDEASELRITPLVSKDVARVFSAKELENGGWLIPVGQLDSREFELWWPSNVDPPEFNQPLQSLEDCNRKRIEAGIPEWGKDIDENSFALEYPLEDEVSFHKGCYLGQEVVARGSYRGQVAKAFVRLKSEVELGEGYLFAEGADEKPCGRVTSFAGTLALGQLRLREFESRKYYLRLGVLDNLKEEKLSISSIDVLSLKVPD